MAAITTGNHPKHLWPGVNAMFGRSYQEKTLQCNMVFEVSSSDKAREEDVEVTGFGLAPRKPEGTAVSYDSLSEGGTATYTHASYGLGAAVSEEAIDDNQYENVAQSYARALGFSMRQTRETVCALVLNRGFNSSYPTYDGKELFATNHPTIYGDQSNELAVAADLSEASLEDILIQIRNARNSRGLKIAIKGKRLIVPPALQFEAERILKSQGRVGVANNDLNALASTGLLSDGYMVYDYLTSSTAWFVQTDAPEGLKIFDRKPIRFARDNDFDTGNAKMKATMRFSAGSSEWRSVYGSPGV